ncbi:hypothetical protein DSM03_10290 [Leeuwenhoekiella aestuarii]|uniref:DUF4179 domain-containing protein n=1 Tax=Leeuwenhoekiella aestuarii TaxID=2249426 RepID=A0A4Q0NX64_9FLAO|nr:DUF4179 domain-containing protein [Leeuwenhoekiella aestuarii]RXG15677.1 hypothetical protein DSM04_103566 [Leeuwenhoekiella aestuarii]RXG17214.1 hypothetical protein DSM03_10290 [Leeuwenhoekiella aestuarii]
MKTNLENWFEEQRDCFDIAEPGDGHELRFLDKLKERKKEEKVVTTRTLDWWKPLAAAAAIVLIVFAGYATVKPTVSNVGLAAVSPEMAKTQDFFTKAIEEELYNINEARTPQTQKLVEDALVQLEILEKDYNKLTNDLATSGEDKRVIYAMIANFQARIDLLNTVLKEIESIKKIKTNDYEDQLL